MQDCGTKIEIQVARSLTPNQLRGTKIRVARIAAKMTQLDLAKSVCSSVDTIRRWERGVLCPDLDEAKAIATTLGQPVGFLE